MKKLLLSLLFVMLATGFGLAQNVPATSIAANSQKTNELTKTFSGFSLNVPNETWRVLSKSSSVELIYGDRLDGYLKISQTAIDEGDTLADVIDREQNQKLQFLPGFANGKEENFKGGLSGRAVNYEFTQSGKPMTGRVYFLQSGKDVYILRFTGLQEKLGLLRNQTDSIARTFKVKKD